MARKGTRPQAAQPTEAERHDPETGEVLTAPAPPDPAAVHREAIEEAYDFNVATLEAEIARQLLQAFKEVQKPWDKMKESEQERVIRRAEDLAAGVVRGALDVFAADGLESIECTIGKIAIGEALEFKTLAPSKIETVDMLMRHKSQAWMMTPLDARPYRKKLGKAMEPDVIGDLAIPKGRPAGATLDLPTTGPAAENPLSHTGQGASAPAPVSA